MWRIDTLGTIFFEDKSKTFANYCVLFREIHCCIYVTVKLCSIDLPFTQKSPKRTNAQKIFHFSFPQFYTKTMSSSQIAPECSGYGYFAV